MAFIDDLKTELAAGHPVTGAYDADEVRAAAQMNATNRSKIRPTMEAHEIINEFDKTEWDALSNAQQNTVWNVLHLGTINPAGIEAQILVAVFGAGSATITALAAARRESISRASELFPRAIRPGDIADARRI